MDIYSGAYYKPVIWLGSSLADMRELPAEAQDDGGYALERVQLGQIPRDWKPMPTVGPGVREIRIRTGREFRILYIVNRPDAVYVLHVFEKKTRKTSWADLERARQRLASIEERK